MRRTSQIKKGDGILDDAVNDVTQGVDDVTDDVTDGIDDVTDDVTDGVDNAADDLTDENGAKKRRRPYEKYRSGRCNRKCR